ncbi:MULTISPECIES: cation:proton antiporter [Dietzia]|uniref:cation:proton antiporter n=1 Tax=Dietzia TaxID=37914 RepID=UPI00223C4213|nr:monovalent cation/H(+) antiporter subunit G [Dietzia cercidiphylli]MCT1516437.1 monovalent cation/H(+) antiporter subunit G [Dietzia cercidiphylli]
MSGAGAVLDVAAIVAAVLGGLFFTAGTLGLLRFPDLRSRLHAVTKADTLGLGFVMLALSLRADSGWEVAKYATIWVLGMAVAAVAATLLATDPDRGAAA